MKSQVKSEGAPNKLVKKQKLKKSADTALKSKLAVKSILSKESNDASVKFSSIKHRNCTGVDNWKKFLESKGMSLKVQNNNISKNNDLKLNNNSKNRKGKKITKAVAMDCEMVGIGEDGEDNMLARVSLVNSYGDCIYDKYVKPREKVVDYRTPVSGIRPEDLKTAEEFDVVQKEVADILKNRILVGHALKNDLSVLFLTHPRYAIRDTAKFFCRKNKRTPSLKGLAAEYLQTTIQEGEHSSVQDAQAAMQLYNLYRKYWESGKGNKSKRRIDNCVSENVADEREHLTSSRVRFLMCQESIKGYFHDKLKRNFQIFITGALPKTDDYCLRKSSSEFKILQSLSIQEKPFANFNCYPNH